MKKLVLMLSCLQLVIMMSLSVLAQSPKQIDLKQFEGYYQSRADTNSYLKFSVIAQQLQLTQLWDDRSLLFDYQSDLIFSTKENPNFTLSFSQNSNHQISTALIFGKDNWDRKIGYQPLPTLVLTSGEKEKIRQELRHKVDAYLTAVNTNSLIKMDNFVRDEVAEDRRKQGPENIYKSTGGVSFYKEILFQPAKRLGVYLLRGKVLNNFFELRLSMNEAKQIVGMDFQEVLVPEFQPKRSGTTVKLVQSLTEVVKQLNQTKMFSGAILLAKNEHILFEHTVGDAIQGKQQNTIHTRFNIGSINKMFTATAIMQLVEAGKLQLNDPIDKYIDTTWLPKAITEKVKIHHLLSHSSGLGDFFSEKYDQAIGSIHQLEDLKPFVRGDQLAFEPGSRWSYSNTGMILLGIVIEKVSGEDYYGYVRAHIYKPANMWHTDAYSIVNGPSDLAHGYILQADGTYQDNSKSSGIWGTSAGGGYATVRDLHQFSLALHDHQLLTKTSTDLLFKAHLNPSYGYGFQLRDTPLGKAIGHTGGAPGVNAVTYSWPATGYHLVVLGNYDRSAQRVADYIINLLR